MPDENADRVRAVDFTGKSDVPLAQRRSRIVDKLLLAAWVFLYALLLGIFRFLRRVEPRASSASVRKGKA